MHASLDEYFSPAELAVNVTGSDRAKTYDVAEVRVSPDWQVGVGNSVASERFMHDIALIITKEPIEVRTPPRLFKLAAADIFGGPSASCAVPNSGAASATPRDTLLRQMLLQRLGRHGVLVAFGAESCRGHGGN